MAKEKKAPTFHEEMEGLLKEKQFVLHGIEITESTEFFSDLNSLILAHLTDHANRIENEEERQDFLDTFHTHFHEIKLLRELYDNLKK